MALAMFLDGTKDDEIYEILKLLLDCGFATGFTAEKWAYRAPFSSTPVLSSKQSSLIHVLRR